MTKRNRVGASLLPCFTPALLGTLDWRFETESWIETSTWRAFESGWYAVFGEDKEESFTINGVEGFYLVEKGCPRLEAVLLAALKALLQDECSVDGTLLFAETVLWLVADVVKDGL
jgi:hypothetical protein